MTRPASSLFSARRLRSSCRLGIVLSILVLTSGCLTEHSTMIGADVERPWQPWQVLETGTGRVLSYSDWLEDLERYDIVYLGEEHFNRYHIEAALRILDHLTSVGIRPSIGMEMFGWDGQPALDHYLLDGETERNDFLTQVRWKQNWGGAFEAYEPLVVFARKHRLPILAMNPPRPLIRLVVKLGLDRAKQTQDWTTWSLQQEDIVDDPAYRAKILDQLRRCHGGGTETSYRTMYEASMVRDEGMAKTLVARLADFRDAEGASGSVIVSYTGSGHIQYNLPIPQRVARRLSGDVKQATIYLTSFDGATTERIEELLQERIADYIWLTPMPEKGPPKPCR